MSRRIILSARVVGLPGVFPIGTRCYWDQDNAPTGWTRDTSVNDRVIRVVSGSLSDGGTWTVGGVTADGHSVTIAQMASHTHTAIQNSGTGFLPAAALPTWNTVALPAGSNSTHTHTYSQDGTWRPLHRDVIVASSTVLQ